MNSVLRVLTAIIFGLIILGCGNKAQRGNIITGHSPVNICKGKYPSVQKTFEEAGSENNAIPCVISQPRYPRKAAMNNVSGYVRFEFTVTSKGKASKIKIIESQPEGVFDKSALTAIKDWRFKPKMEDGVAVAQNNMKYTMEFKMVK